MRHDRDEDRSSDRSRAGPAPGPRIGDAPGRPAAVVLAAALALAGGRTDAAAQEAHGDHTHEDAGDGHHRSLHFTHPMVAESVTPDTKIRLDHQFFEFADGVQENSGVVEAEYAFGRFFSVEASVPYSYSEGEAGKAGAMLKFANYALEESGVVLGYGVDMAFPTAGAAPEEGHEHEEEGEHAHGRVRAATSGPGGSGAIPGPDMHTAGSGVRTSLGSEHWEVGPYLNVGWKSGPVELSGWTVFEIPFDQHEQSEVGTELGWNVAGLYHVSSRVDALLELDGGSGISGPRVGEDVVNLSPGLRVQVLPDTPLVLGSSVGVPLAAEEPFDVRWTTSIFWHFPR